MEQLLPDIPRVYTALAEWLACVIYILPLRKRFAPGKTALLLGGFLLAQIGIQIVAGMLPISFWLLGMLVAVLCMFGCMMAVCKLPLRDVGYCCARAFITAEFAASFGWQLYYSLFWEREMRSPLWQMIVLLGVYGLVFAVVYGLESRRLPADDNFGVTRGEFLSVVLIVIAAFSIGNINFVLSGASISKAPVDCSTSAPWLISVVCACSLRCKSSAKSCNIDTSWMQ